MVSGGLRSAAAARRWGAAWASGRAWARGGAHGPRGAQSPARAGSLKSTARSSRAAVPQAVRSWQPRAGSLGVSLPHLESQGLSQAPAVSSGLSLRFGERASSPVRLLEAREWRRARGSRRRRRGARRQTGGLPWVLCPARGLAFRRLRWNEKQASCLSRPPSRLPFFPVLQILGSSSSGNAGRKLAREGGGGWKFLAALSSCVYGAGGSRWVG